jgi:hypothetical protein
MASAVQREVRITYGSLVIGDAEDLQPDGPILLRETGEEFVCEFAFIYSVPPGDPTPEVTFETTIASIEGVLNTRQLALLVEYGADLAGFPRTRASYDPVAQTGLNIRSQWEATRTIHHTNRSVRYEISITGELPADKAGQLGNRDFAKQVVFDACRRATVTFTGVWTALPGTPDDAWEAFEDNAATQEAAYLALRFPTETFQLEGDQRTPGDDDQTMSFSRTYEQLIDEESSGLLDDPDFVRQSLTITRQRRQSRDPSRQARPLLDITAAFETCVLISAATGIPELKEKLETKLLPWIVTRMKETVGGETVAISNVGVDFEPKRQNLLRIRIAGVAAQGGTVIERTITTGESEASNDILRKTYPNGTEAALGLGGHPNLGKDPDGFARVPIPRAFRFRVAGTVRRTITDTREVIGNPAVGKPASGGGGGFISVGIGAGARFNLDRPFNEAFGIGVISEVGESFLEFLGPEGGTDSGSGGGAGGGGGGGGQTTAIVVGRDFGNTPSSRGLRDLGGRIATTLLTTTLVLEFFVVAEGASGGGRTPQDATMTANEGTSSGPSGVSSGGPDS